MARALFFLLAVGTRAMVLKRTQFDAHTFGRCVVWHSQHKSAGQRIENNLVWHAPTGARMTTEDWRQCAKGCRFICDSETWDCDKQKCVEPSFYQPLNGFQFAMRGYVQTLQGSRTWGRAGDGKCVWATMAREPVSRLVSAYLYCKHEGSGDPLCGRSRLRRLLGRESDATLHEFAEHWGNYLFRELLWFPELRALAESRPDFNRTSFNCNDEPWVEFKDQLNGGDDIETASGKRNFGAVKDSLLGRRGRQPLYDVIGLLEDWENSMLLFDRFMPLREFNWSNDTSVGGTHNSWKYEGEKRSLLKKAQHDPVVLKFLAGDIILYNEVIVPLFQKQLKQHNSGQ